MFEQAPGAIFNLSLLKRLYKGIWL